MQWVYKLVGYIVLMLGGSLVGAMAGSAQGPVVLELNVEQVAHLGGFLGAILTLGGCCFAMEYHEARSRNEQIRGAIERRMVRLAGPHGTVPALAGREGGLMHLIVRKSGMP